MTKEERDAEIKELRSLGFTYAAIGRRVKLTGCRVSQIVNGVPDKLRAYYRQYSRDYYRKKYGHDMEFTENIRARTRQYAARKREEKRNARSKAEVG